MLPKAARTPEQPALQFVDLIGQLYAVEKRARDHKLSAADRLVEQNKKGPGSNGTTLSARVGAT